MSEAKLAVQRALDKLINRFGTTGEVIGELRAALALMDKGNAVPAAIPPPEEPEPEEAPAPSEPEAEPRPSARKSMGRKK